MLTRTSTMLLEGLKDPANRTAWLEFDARYRPVLLAVARRLGLCEHDAEDAAQETAKAFATQYNQGRYSRAKGRLRDWLSGIMAHKVRDLQRKAARQRKAMRRYRPPASEIEDGSVEAAIEAEWDNAILRQCLQELRQEVLPKTIETFELYALKQWPPEQVAQRCGVSVAVVYQNKRRILKRINEIRPRIEEQW